MKLFIIFPLLLMLLLPQNTRATHGEVSVVSDVEIYITTDDGNGWVLDPQDGYAEGDKVTIVFNTLGDTDMYNDEIITIVKE
jgi:hypothetical protein